MKIIGVYSCFARGAAVLSNAENHNRLKKIVSDLDSLTRTLDELYLREVRAAFESISDAYLTTNKETKDFRLRFAEENLLKNSCLDINLSIGGCPSSSLMGLVHYGLSIICYLRNDSNIAFKHILQTYKYSPRLARTVLFPEFYTIAGMHDEVTQRVSSWHEKELESLNKNTFGGEELLRKTGAVGLAAAALATAMFLGTPPVAIVASKQCSKMWQESNPSHLRAEAISALENRIEGKKDEFCSVLANELLIEFNNM